MILQAGVRKKQPNSISFIPNYFVRKIKARRGFTLNFAKAKSGFILQFCGIKITPKFQDYPAKAENLSRLSLAALRANFATAKSGFTLIELTLVILLISVLAGISTPLFKRTVAGLALKNASFNIAKTANFAQEMAIVDKVKYKLNFDFEGGRFWITRLDDSQSVYKKIKGRYGKFFTLPKGVYFKGENEETVFYPDGRSDKLSIKIVDAKGQGNHLIAKGFARKIVIEEIKK